MASSMGWAQRLLRRWQPWTAGDVRTALLAAVEREEQDAASKIADRWYWRQTGFAVSEATRTIRATIEALRTDGLSARVYFDLAQEALAAGHERYRQEAIDEDGFGSGTWWDVRRAADAIGRRLPPA